MNAWVVRWVGCVLGVAVVGCGLTLDLEPEENDVPAADLGPPRADGGGTNVCERADGVECELDDGDPGVCIGGACVPGACGDGVVSGYEDCDDGNTVDGDTCPADCATDCDSLDECPAPDSECLASRCEEGLCVVDELADGTLCEANGVCRGGMCAPVTCGDGIVDTGEFCDDGDSDVPGDGCESDCTPSCQTNSDCDNGLHCDGAERCVAVLDGSDGAKCEAGTPLEPERSCDYCDPATGEFELVDDDRDGFTPIAGPDCGPVDCDDTDPTRYPGAPEVTNGIDSNCDGVVVTDMALTCYRDADEDTFGDRRVSTTVSDGECPDGFVEAGPHDCNDDDARARPNQTGFFGEAHCRDPAGGDCTFDYNCDGREERKYLDRARCVFETRDACTMAPPGWTEIRIPECGELGSVSTCVWTPLGVCRPSLRLTARQQVCR